MALLPSGDGATPAPSGGPVQPPGQVPGARFLVVRMREGYDIGEVDAFVDRILAAALTTDEVRQVQFTTVRLRAGYDMQAVDEYLDEVAAWLETAAATGAGGAAEPVETQSTNEWRESLTERYELLKAADRPAGDRFRTVRLREGYDPGEVDAFVDRILAAALTTDEVRQVQFTTVRLRAGYDMQAVDEYLDEVAAWLETAAATGAGAAVESAAER